MLYSTGSGVKSACCFVIFMDSVVFVCQLCAVFYWTGSGVKSVHVVLLYSWIV